MLDAATGKPVTAFGNGGAVPLNQGLPRMGDITHMSQSSPPVVYRNLVIVGSQVPDRVQLPDPLGWVQAFDARTGRRVWAFSTIPQSEKEAGADTWENGSWRTNGHANVWAPMALDEARGLLYSRRPRRPATTTAGSVPAPTSSPSRSCVWTPPPAG